MHHWPGPSHVNSAMIVTFLSPEASYGLHQSKILASHATPNRKIKSPLCEASLAWGSPPHCRSLSSPGQHPASVAACGSFFGLGEWSLQSLSLSQMLSTQCVDLAVWLSSAPYSGVTLRFLATVGQIQGFLVCSLAFFLPCLLKVSLHAVSSYYIGQDCLEFPKAEKQLLPGYYHIWQRPLAYNLLQALCSRH